MALTAKQREMLLDFKRDGEATDLCAFSGGKTFDWLNRERVITALHRKGYLTEDGITDAGRTALGGA